MEERVSLGPKVAEGEDVFGVAHIFASFNDTFVVSLGPPTPPIVLSLYGLQCFDTPRTQTRRSGLCRKQSLPELSPA